MVWYLKLRRKCLKVTEDNYKQKTGNTHPSTNMSAVEVFVQNMKPAHHKQTLQHHIRVVDPDLPHIEEEDDDDGYDSEDNENAFIRSQTFTLEEDEILTILIVSSCEKRQNI